MNEEQPPQRRETIMERRLRKARGEEVEDTFADMHDDGEQGYDSMHPPAGIGMPHYVGPAGTGCNQGLVIGGVAILAIIVLALFFSTQVEHLTDLIPAPFGNIGSMPEVLASPTPTLRTDAAAVVRRVQQLQRLEVTSYTIEKVIEAGVDGNAFQNLLFGDHLLLIAHGTVVAGLDLSTIAIDDVTVSEDGTSITIQLPPVQVFNITLDNSKTRVYDRQQGLLAPTNKDLETLARQAAEDEIVKAACEDGLMQRATNDGQHAIEKLFGLLEFEQVEVLPAQVPPCPVGP